MLRFFRLNVLTRLTLMLSSTIWQTFNYIKMCKELLEGWDILQTSIIELIGNRKTKLSITKLK